jgi:signal peptidase II
VSGGSMKYFRIAFIASVVFLFDRLLKQIVITRLSYGESVPVLKGIFHITRVHNSGAAFGILRGGQQFLVIISMLFIFGIIVFIYKKRMLLNHVTSVYLSTALALLIGGACGNLYDRIFYNKVIDYLDFRIWPVFNIADASICIGIFIIVAREALKPRRFIL